MLVLAMACEDDGVTPPPPPSAYKDLSQREHVLANLELAYNRRELENYEDVLDENFAFFFYIGDVGGDIPAQWGWTDEVAAHTNLFNPGYVDTDPSDGTMPACKKTALDLKWEEGVQWQEIPQLNGEDWYATTVFYNFQFDIGEYDHLVNNPGSKAQFTVRNAGTEEDPRWQLVEMHDLDQDLRSRTAAGTEQSTWGSVKAIYR
jgi:hypothetical protein